MLGMVHSGMSQVQVPFAQRTSSASPERTVYNIRGDFTMMGNTNMTMQNYSPSGNNNTTMIYVDVDGDPNTFNSSAATLVFSEENNSIPECSEIIYAGLYWSGRASRGPFSPMEFQVTKNGVTKTLNKRQVKIKHASGEYQTITALPNNIYFPENSESLMYSAYAEVTDLVKSNGLGQYFVADIATTEGRDTDVGYYGGWGMVVVYENSKMNWRDVTVFDGHAYVTGSRALEYQIPIEGFQTSQSGPVNIKLGIMAGEGDEDLSGNYLEIESGVNTGNFLRLSHSGNTPDNFFNSSIITGGTPRMPALVNNTGMDIAMFNVPNPDNSVIGNSQTSTRFRYGSTRDRYIIYNLTFSADAYVPDILGANKVVTINGQEVTDTDFSVVPGQEVGFQVDITNTGSEPLENVELVIPLPFTASHIGTSGAVFFANSTEGQAYFDADRGPYGSIIWNIGDLPLPSALEEGRDYILASLNYTLRATEDCLILLVDECVPSIPVQGGLSGIGGISASPFNNIPFITGYQEGGTCVGEPITAPLNISINLDDFDGSACENLGRPLSYEFCNYDGENIPLAVIEENFPEGLRYYNMMPGNNVDLIEYTAQNPFPATPGEAVYVAVPDGLSGLSCAYRFTIIVKNIASVPAVENHIICEGDDIAGIPAPEANIGYDGRTLTLYGYANEADESPFSLTISEDENIITAYLAQFINEGEPLATGTYQFFIAEGYSEDCIGEKVAVNITVVNNVDAPSVTHQTFESREGNVFFLATAAEGNTLSWYDDANGERPLEAVPSISLATPGVYTVYVNQVSASGCESSIVPVTVTVMGESALAVIKSADTDILPVAGEVITYTIAVRNIGNTVLNDITVLDPLTAFEDVISSLAPGATAIFTTAYTVTAIDVERGMVTNVASAASLDESGNDVGAEDTLTIYMPTAPVDPVDPIVPTDPVPVTIQANDDAFGSLLSAQGGSLGNILNNDLLNGSTVNAQEVNFTFTDLDGVIGLIIEADGTLSILPDAAEARAYNLVYELRETANPSNRDIGNVTFRILEDADISLSKTTNTTSLMVGEMVTYDINLINQGTVVLENIQIQDLLPEALMFISSSIAGSDDLIFTIATLAPGATVNIQIDALAVTAGQVINVATAIVGTTQVSAEAPEVTILSPSVDLSITKSSMNAQIYEGDEFTYEIRVENRGDVNATNVLVTDDLPGNLTYISGNVSQGVEVLADVVGSTLTWRFPSFPAQTAVTITLTVKAGNAGTVVNEVLVTADQEDSLPEDNSAVDENTIRPIFFPNVITPNGDGKNDMFIIHGLDKFERNDIVIFNRWGDHVFESGDYQNNWSAEGLNPGTYYYVMVSTGTNGQKTTFKGWIQVIKNAN
ncbi:hypothetical protein EL17_12740 [Anditalea andensis]|uniref:DUF11 domain-containing protein n=2 Tax=Anditalea andensis TaxID=1048983 RepID=A0A074KYD5_9BACT|nr:hypothetical protein EL17_12740 [Anditalea andensis]